LSKFFLDTNILLDNNVESIVENNEFYVSIITLQELEHIKTSFNKDESTKEKARKALHFLKNNENRLHIASPFAVDSNELNHNNDELIISSILNLDKKDITFVTKDLACYMIAKNYNINVLYPEKKIEEYHGYKEMRLSQEEAAEFYANGYEENKYKLLNNEYLIIADEFGNIFDHYKYSDNQLIKVPYTKFNSKMFGKIVPKDVYQECLLDSFNTNKVTLVGGPAGSGKTFMSLGYLFYLLEKGEIDRIVIFCNPVVAKNAAKLGFYPGTVLEKLLSTQVGAVLSSKLGDITEVERLVNQGSLVLMPAGDSRGYEVPAHSGVYIMESQNLDIVLLRMILQRIGEDCITIVDGDREEQTDMEIYANDNNGMARMSEVFKGSKIFGQVDLKYIYRSEIASIADYM
jgi:predicted ribonuclease YlaK